MKKLMNRPENAVSEMLDGLVAIHGGLARLSDHSVLVRRDIDQVREKYVALISGGGSGHEPAHGGYVGHGMLSAAVAGEVFSSPSPGSVLAAVRAVAGRRGALLIVKNYTGDRLNFGLAAEMARSEDISIEMVVVADDIALINTEQYAGARGIAGTVLVHKVAGAAAAEGRDLASVAAIAHECAASVATMGIALSAGILPSSGAPTFQLDEDEIELGLGIHGEPGIRRAPLRTADELAAELVENLIDAQALHAHEAVAVMINNLGSTTLMELAIFARAALTALASKGLSIERVYAGSFMTSLEAAGVSLSTLRLNEERLHLLDAPTFAPAWPSHVTARPEEIQRRIINSRQREPEPVMGKKTLLFTRSVLNACEAIEQAEEQLTALDQVAGDGDLGHNLARGARAVRQKLLVWECQTPPEALKTIGITLQNIVGGSSGALYSILLLRAAHVLAQSPDWDLYAWASAFVQGCAAVSEAGGASAGDRTMLDALFPFATTLMDGAQKGKAVAEVLEMAVVAAEEGAVATANMLPRRGRASYVRERALGHQDAGAVAAAVWLRAIGKVLVGPERT
jgi:triose/dihydroxyacetone kinase / FAD-AMP lyase (cyclizing)